MIKNMIRKADYKAIEKTGPNSYHLMFKVGDVTTPIYQTDLEGNTAKNDNGNPIVVEYAKTDYCDVLACDYKGELSEQALKNLVNKFINSETDARILSGFRWNDIPVWLSSENQFNYKAAYDIAVQTNGTNLPVTFKLGTDDKPVYHEFTTVEELGDFYMRAIAFITQVLAEGWAQKDSMDYSQYIL